MYNNGNSSKNVTGASVVDGTLENADYADNGLSGDKIDGGIISNFQSTGIDDRLATGKSIYTNGENVGIGISTPARELEIQGPGNVYLRVTAIDPSRDSAIELHSVNEDWTMRNAYSSGDLSFSNTSEKVRILSSGGITFNGDTAAANALDDYEEGTWTPSIADASSGGNENALGGTFNYTKIGNTVHLWGLASNFSTAGLTAGNDVYVTGLPFTSGSETPCSIWWQNMNINNTGMIVPRILNGYSVIRFDEMVDNTNAEAMIVSDFASGTVDFRIQATYKV
jgi:hypothetical protein